MKVYLLCLGTLVTFLPNLSWAEPSFLKDLNKTLGQVAKQREERFHKKNRQRYMKFLNQAKNTLSSSELEKLENDFQIVHNDSLATVEQNYRRNLLKTESIPNEELKPIENIRELSQVLVSRHSEDFLFSPDYEQEVNLASFSSASAEMLPTPSQTEQIPEEEVEYLEVQYKDLRYKLPKDLGPEQLLLETAIDFQESQIEVDDEDENLSLFKRISTAYKKRYRTFSKRIQEKDSRPE